MRAKIGVVRGGGDCAGFNAVIGGTATAEEMGWT
jgi:6-phosphofructokinase